jgi:hypothetical protein
VTVESLPRTEAPPPAADVDAAPEPSTPGPPHLADPRALQILSTEHWSLLTARSLAYNEFFSRGAMFLTFLSASLVALGFVYQGAKADFVLVLIPVLALDLFVGLATLGRLAAASSEEILAVQAMNRIRHAYLEMVPTLDPYMSTSRHDDIGSVLAVYGATPAAPSALLNVLHGLTTMPGMVSVLDAAIGGALAGSVAVALGADLRFAVIVGIAAGVAFAAILTATMVRSFTGMSNRIVARFPAADAMPYQPPGRRNT